MEYTGSAVHGLDNAFMSSRHFDPICDYNYMEARKIYDALTIACAAKVPRGEPSGNQFFKSMQRTHDMSIIHRTLNAVPPARERAMINDTGRASDWGTKISYENNAVNTFRSAQFLMSKYEPFRATWGVLPQVTSRMMVIYVGDTLAHLIDSSAASVDDVQNQIVKVYINLKVEFCIDGIPLDPGTPYRNTVSMCDNAGLVYIDQTEFEFNNNHSRDLYTRDVNTILLKNQEQTRVNRIIEYLSGKKTATQYVTKHGPVNGEFKVGGQFAETVKGVLSGGQLMKYSDGLREVNPTSHHVEEVNKGEEFIKEVRKVEDGPTCPRYEQNGGYLGSLIMTYENTAYDKSEPSGSYGTQLKTYCAQIAPRQNVLRVEPGRVKVHIISSIVSIANTQDRHVGYVHETVFPFIGSDSVVEGGSFSSHKLCSIYYELTSGMNNKLIRTTFFHKTEIPRITVDTLQTLGSRFNLTAKEVGMITPAAIITGRRNVTNPRHYGFLDTQLLFGEVHIAPYVEITQSRFFRGAEIFTSNITEISHNTVEDFSINLTNGSAPTGSEQPVKWIADFPMGTRTDPDNSKLNELLLPVNPTGVYVKEEVCGYQVYTRPLIDHLGIKLSTVDFLPVQDTPIHEALSLNRKLCINDLTKNIYEIPFAPGGSDPTLDTGGPNASRIPNIVVHGALCSREQNPLVNDNGTGHPIQIMQLHTTGNVRLTDSYSQFDLYA